LYENFETDILSLPSKVWTSLVQKASHVSGNPARFHLNNAQTKQIRGAAALQCLLVVAF
jgi:hypothetical protein